MRSEKLRVGRTVRGLGRIRNREKNEKERREEGDRKEDRKRGRLEGYGQREEDETTEGVRNCDRTEKRGRKMETGSRNGGYARKVFVIAVFYFFLES